MVLTTVIGMKVWIARSLPSPTKQSNTGTAFEIAVYSAVQHALIQGDLGLLKNSCRLARGKRYYSADRRAWMVTDLSIELYVAKARRPAILWVWECKDYSGAVQVNEVEEFHAKLEQLGADRTKGTLIAHRQFQKSALVYAKSKGIGIARLLPSKRIEWVFHNRTVAGTRIKPKDVASAILSPAPEIKAHSERLLVLSRLGTFTAYPSLREYVDAEIRALAHNACLEIR